MMRKEIRGFIKKNNLEESRMNKLEIKSRKQEGITLIVLIITVIIMLILAGVTISALMKDGRLFEKTQVAVDMYSQESNKESALIEQLEGKLDEVSGEAILQVEDENPGILSGTGTESDPYLIESIEDLMAFSNAVNGIGTEGNRIVTNRTKNSSNANSYEGEFVKLACNLDFESDLSYVEPTRTDFGDVNEFGGIESLKEELITREGKGFFSIGYYKSYSFKGNFLGDKHIIKNLYINKGFSAGFFGYVENSKISDFQLAGEIICLAQISSTGYGCGCLAFGACGEVEISNFINKCNVQGSAVNTNYFSGVIASYEFASKLHLNNVINMGRMTITNNGNCMYLGGLICSGAWMSSTYNTDIFVENSGNYGEVIVNNGGTTIGGIIARIQDVSENIRIVNSYNKGKIKANNQSFGCFAAGIVGENKENDLESDYYVENCKNYADIFVDGTNSNENIVAGIVGGHEYGGSTMMHIENCTNYGNITAVNNKSVYYSHAIATGIFGKGINVEIYNCENYGNIDSSGGNGSEHIASSGIFGIANCNVFNSSNYGSIKSLKYAAGIGGFAKAIPIIVDSCKNYGEVEGGEVASGIVGYTAYGDALIRNSYNIGEITGKKVAGIVASDTTYKNTSPYYLCSVQNSCNFGKLNSTSNTNISYGIMTGCAGTTTVELLNCYNISPSINFLSTRTDNTNLANLYYLDTCCSDPGSTVCEAKTEAFMKSQEFIDLLNANVAEHNSSSEIVWKTWVRDENTGYPIISD